MYRLFRYKLIPVKAHGQIVARPNTRAASSLSRTNRVLVGVNQRTANFTSTKEVGPACIAPQNYCPPLRPWPAPSPEVCTPDLLRWQMVLLLRADSARSSRVRSPCLETRKKHALPLANLPSLHELLSHQHHFQSLPTALSAYDAYVQT